MADLDRRDGGHVPRGTGGNVTDVTTIVSIDKHEMAGLASVEYERLFGVLESLAPGDWVAQTPCGDWDIRAMVAHLLGAAESNASLMESVRQLRAGRAWARKHNRPEIDGINAIQVDARADLGPDELIARLRRVAPKAIAGRQKVPAPLRRMSVANPAGGRMSMGHLLDRVYTRDQWMHRLDICTTVGIEPEITADHDRRIVEDVVAEWAAHQAGPWTLELTGPAGGSYVSGGGGDLMRFDALEYCLIVSGRAPSTAPMAQIVF